MLTGYDVCCMYRAIKLHFVTEKYDYIKYSGKIKYTREQFSENKHQMVYNKLANRFTRKEIYEFILANFVEGDDIWIVDLANNIDSSTRYNNWLKRNQSLTYNFTKELEIILESENVFKVPEEDYPNLLKMYFRNEISIETILILNYFLQFIPRWDKLIKDDIRWPKTRLKLVKYGKLFTFDILKFKNLIKSKLEKNYGHFKI